MVYLQKTDSYREEEILSLMKDIFDAHGGIEKFGGQGVNVVIKPNLVAAKKPEEAATTHPSLVWACAKLLTDTGANVTIAESPGGLYDRHVLSGLYRTCGIEEAAGKAGAKLNFDTTTAKISNENGKYLKTLSVLTPLAEADVIIDIAKLKTHGMMVYTGAVKNMFGAVAGVGKAEYHCKMPDYDSFADTIIDIFLSVKPKLSIIDAVVSMHKDGPTAGEPINTGFLISSCDAFEADLTAMYLIGAQNSRIPLYRAARERKLIPESIKDIEIKGDNPEELKTENFVVKYNDDMSRLHFSDGFFGKMVSLVLKPRPHITKKCRSCGKCRDNCPVKAITVEKGKKASVNLDICIRCYCCQELCPFKAVEIKKTLISRMVTG